jgi:thimet oligopeptidase
VTYIKRRAIGVILAAGAVAIAGCAKQKAAADSGNGPAPVVREVKARLIRSDYAPGELTSLCATAIQRAQLRIEKIVAVAINQRSIDNTLLALENAMADLADATQPLSFMGSVSTDAAVSKEAADCDQKLGQFNVTAFTRRDLYQTLTKLTPRNSDEARLLEQTVEGFESNGLKLSDETLAKVRDLKVQLANAESQFSTNLNNDTSSVTFTPQELAGVPASILVRFAKRVDCCN